MLAICRGSFIFPAVLATKNFIWHYFGIILGILDNLVKYFMYVVLSNEMNYLFFNYVGCPILTFEKDVFFNTITIMDALICIIICSFL